MSNRVLRVAFEAEIALAKEGRSDVRRFERTIAPELQRTLDGEAPPDSRA